MEAIAGYGSSSSDDTESHINSSTSTTTNEPNEDNGPIPDQNPSDNGNKRRKLATTTARTAPASLSILNEQQARELAVFSRNEPHVRGNWAGLVYLSLERAVASNDVASDDDESDSDNSEVQLAKQEWKEFKQDGCNRVQDLVSNQQLQHQKQHARVKQMAPPSNTTPTDKEPSSPPCLVLHDDPHISLTQTFFLQQASIASFLRRLRQVAKSSTTCTSSGGIRVALSSGVVTLVNDTQTRLFFAWPVIHDGNGVDDNNISGHAQQPTPNTRLHDLVLGLNNVLQEYQQPPYYHPPKFHASFASMPIQGEKMIQHILDSSSNINSNLDVTEDDDILELFVSQISCRIGDQVHSFPLH